MVYHSFYLFIFCLNVCFKFYDRDVCAAVEWFVLSRSILTILRIALTQMGQLITHDLYFKNNSDILFPNIFFLYYSNVFVTKSKNRHKSLLRNQNCTTFFYNKDHVTAAVLYKSFKSIAAYILKLHELKTFVGNMLTCFNSYGDINTS